MTILRSDCSILSANKDKNCGSFKDIFGKESKQDEESAGMEEQNDQIELDKYLSLCTQSTVHDSLQWWNTNRGAFPVLAWLSRKWLCAALTSVSWEHLFSCTGATVTARRSRLKDDHVEMLTYVHDNIKYSF